MFKFAKRATSAVVAGAVVLSTLSVYPAITGKKNQVNAATLYDSASAINYATILGGAVDYGIVADKVIQSNHTETNFATNYYEHISDNIDVDYTESTALFLVGDYKGGEGDNRYIRFGYTTAEAIYFEAPEEVFNGYDPSIVPKANNQPNGNIKFEGAYTNKPFVQAVNPSASVNVNRLINRICSQTAVEDAEMGWSYFLQSRAVDPAYTLDEEKISISKPDDRVVIDATSEEYDGKVVYINVTPEMLPALAKAEQFIIRKNPSSVIVLNINGGTNVNEGGKNVLRLAKPSIEIPDPSSPTGYVSYNGHTASNGGSNDAQREYAKAVQENYNQTVIWNLMGSEDIELQCSGGAVLAPNTKNVTLVNGNSCGWVVTKGTFNMDQEFHFLYSGSSRDSYGQMHFALTKAFTKNYAAHGTVQQDTSVDIPDDTTYSFNFMEYSRPNLFGGEFQMPYYRGYNENVYVKKDGTVTFPIITFTCEGNGGYYDIPRGQEKMFYFRVRENAANSSHAVSGKDQRIVSNSDGYVDIRLKVAVDAAGNFTYFVDYKSVSGDGVVFREYQEDYTDYIKMSGVQFDLGAFYNKVTEADQVYIDITKTFGGGVTAHDLENLTFKIYEVDTSKPVQTSKVVASYKFGDDFEQTGTPGVYALKNKFAAETGKTYYVEECNYDLAISKEVTVTYQLPNGKAVDATADGKTSGFTVAASNTINDPYVVSFRNDYKLYSGKIVLTKTIEGPVTDKDIEGLTFEVYKEGSTTPVWTGSLADTTGSAPKFTVDANGVYTSEEIGVDIGNYYVVEKLTTEAGSVEVTYKINNTDGNPVADYDNKEVKTAVFGVGRDETAKLDFKNTYKGGSIQLYKEVEGEILAGVNGFPVVIKGNDDKYYDEFGTAYDAEKLVYVSITDGVKITNLPAQDYLVYEKDPGSYAALGYKLNINSAQSFYVTVEAGQTTEKTFKNIYDEVPIVGSLSITKEQATGSAEIGANETFDIEVVFDGDISSTSSSAGGTINFTDRTWKISLKVGETATLSDIPAGVNYTIKETVPDGYKDVADKSGAIPAVGGEVSEVIENYKNTLTTGSLVISKTISEADLEDFEKLTFTVVNTADADDKIKVPDLTTDAVKAGDWKDEGNGVYTYTVENLDAGKTYKVTETYDGTGDSSEYVLDTSKSTKTGTGKIVAGGEVIVELTDTYTKKTTPVETGSLVISKTISEADLEDFEKLTFKVVNTADDSDVIDVPDLTTANVTAGKWKDEGNGVYTYTVENLDAGKTYKVTETYDGTGDSSEYVLNTSKSTKTGTGKIVAGGEVVVELTDTYTKKTTPVETGSLVISKTISGAALNELETIRFKVEDVNSSDTLSVPALTKSNVNAGIWTDEGNGVYTFTFENLKAGTTYKVTETYDGTGDSTEYVLNTSKSTKTGTGKIVAGGEVVVELTDTYTKKTTPVETGSLVISKTISGAALNELETIRFKVEDVDSSDTLSVPALTKSNVNAGIWTDEGNGVYTFTFENLKAGTTYKVTETYDGTGDSTEYVLNTSKSTKTGTETIVAGGEVKVELTNAYEKKTTPVETGSLVISKTISEADLEDFEKLTFTVVNTADADDKIDVPDLTTDAVKAGDWKDEGNGVYTYTVENLDAGKTYKVTETYDGTGDSSEYVLDTSKSTKTGTGKIVAGGEVVVELTDTYTKKTTPVETGSLVISKTISGAALNELETIRFKVEDVDSSDTLSVPALTKSNVNAGIWTDEGNGVYTFTFENLKAGTTYKVTETYDGTGDSTEYVLNTSKSTKTGTETIVAGGEVKVELTNAYEKKTTPVETGSLVISKTISEADLEDFEKLTFKVVNTADDSDVIDVPDLTTDAVKAGDWKDEGNGVYTYTVENLDAGKTYKVTETYDGTGDSSEYVLDTSASKTSGTGTVVAGGEVIVELTDTYTKKTTPVETGSLVISKTISGADLEDFEKLTFTVVNTFDDSDVIDVPDLTTANVTAGKWKDEGNGVYTFTVEDLDAGKTYKVTETYDGTGDSTEYVLDTSKSTKTGTETIVAGGDVIVELTDTYTKKTTPVETGSLVISKTISGADLEDFEKLTFTVVNTADSDDTIKVPDLTTENVKKGLWKDEGNGVYTFTVEDLDAGKTYKVTETYDGTGDSSEYVLDTSASKTSGTGTVVAGGDVIVEITDTYKNKSISPVTSGELILSKTISGAALEDFEKLSFTIVNAADASDVIDVPDLTTANVKAGIWKDEGNGVYTFSVENLDAGKTYKVTETYDGTGDYSEYILDTSSKTSGTGTVVGGGTVTVEITDDYIIKSSPLPSPETGTIEITKAILGVDPSDLDPSQIIFVIEGPSTFNDGNVMTVTYGDLVDGRWIMNKVPAGDYTVTETANGASAVYPLITTSVNNKDAVSDTVTLSKDGMASFAFINNYEDTTSVSTGTIEITKTLSGAFAADLNVDEMIFTIEGPDSYNGGKIKTISYSDFVDGRWHEDDVPAGTYTVTETGSGETQTLELVLTTVNGAEKSADTKTLATDGIISFAFVNTYEDMTPVTGSLSITKVIKGDYPDGASDNTFKFTVKGPSYPDGIVVTITGEGTETLEDLVPGDYTVTENVSGAEFTNYSLEVSGNGSEVTVEAGKTAECEIINTYTKITPPPTPTPIDEPGPWDHPGPTDTPTPVPTIPDSGLKLTFEKKDEQGSLIANAVLTLTSEDGFDMSGVKVTQNGKEVSFILSADKKSISFTTVDTAPSIVSGLKAGRYMLSETVTPEGYLTASSIHFVLNADGSFDEGGGKVTVAGSPVIMIDQADPSYKKDGSDDEGTSIPATGENMSYYAIAGVMLLGLCAAFVAGFAVYQKKKSGI